MQVKSNLILGSCNKMIKDVLAPVTPKWNKPSNEVKVKENDSLTFHVLDNHIKYI